MFGSRKPFDLYFQEKGQNIAEEIKKNDPLPTLNN